MSGREPVADARLPGRPVDRLRAAAGLVVALDFDGTLAPVVADAAEAAITPANRAVLERLADRDDAMPAVVSGRSISDLRSRVGVDGVVYAGNHGLEIAPAGLIADGDRPDLDAYRPAVADACEAVRGLVGDVPGCTVEDKGPTATVHYRQTPPGRVGEVRETVAGVVDDEDVLELRPAKQALEIRPAVEWDKGSVVRLLADEAPDGWSTLYLGDDVTDEDAFRALDPGDVGIRIGGDDDTAADHRLPDQRATAPYLAWLAEEVLAG